MYHELTVWSRGIIMDKEARDVSSCIAAAARALGYYADNVSDYVDDPDRTNCLVRRYARFGDSPIVDRFVYENPHPDWVVLVEETIVKAVNFLRGTPDGGGMLVDQLRPRPEYLLQVPARRRCGPSWPSWWSWTRSGLAEQRGGSPWMFVRNLSELAFDRMSTEGAEERLAIGLGIAAPLIGALVAATGELPVDDGRRSGRRPGRHAARGRAAPGGRLRPRRPTGAQPGTAGTRAGRRQPAPRRHTRRPRRAR